MQQKTLDSAFACYAETKLMADILVEKTHIFTAM